MVEISPLIGRGQRMSAAAYTGRAVAPGAVVESDPEAKALITKNSLQLGIVTNQMQNLTAQMQSLAGSLQVIGTNLRAQNELEEAKDQQEAELQNKLAQEKLREGKESSIEKKIQAAAIAPAQRIGAKAQFTLTRLSNLFRTIVGGWLLQKGVETIIALNEGNTDKLNEIKNNILKNLLVAGAVMAAVKLAIPALTAAFTGIGLKLAAIGIGAIFSGPILQFLGFLTEMGKLALNKMSGGLLFNNEEEEPPTGTGGPSLKSTTEDYDPNNPSGVGGLSLSTGSERLFTASQYKDFVKNRDSQPAPVVKNTFSMAPLDPMTPEEIKEASNNGTLPTVNMSAVFERPESKEDEPIDPNVKAEYGETSMQPVDTPAAPEMDGEKTPVPSANKGGENQWWDLLDLFPNPPSASIDPVNKTQQVAQTVSQAPAEPGVTVVPIQTQPEQKVQSQPLVSGRINEAPFFTPHNPDNIYTLGARSNFNVVSV